SHPHDKHNDISAGCGGRPLFPYVVTQVCRDPPFPTYLKFIADMHTYGRFCRWWMFLVGIFGHQTLKRPARGFRMPMCIKN
ncbi:MAG: hypothetical protein AAFQ52_10185, partial [Chloroflexota bacterium]